jgi:hypothetical protein
VTTKKVEVEKVVVSIPDEAACSKILRTVSHSEAFHFYRDIGQPLGVSATSLSDFCEKVKTVDIKSVVFHFKRGDFGKWIREVFGDEELAKRIGKIWARGEGLRNEICSVVKKRLDELKTKNP